jgi:hypothetical protein
MGALIIHMKQNFYNSQIKLVQVLKMNLETKMQKLIFFLDYGASSHRTADIFGFCVCEPVTLEIGVYHSVKCCFDDDSTVFCISLSAINSHNDGII